MGNGYFWYISRPPSVNSSPHGRAGRLVDIHYGASRPGDAPHEIRHHHQIPGTPLAKMAHSNTAIHRSDIAPFRRCFHGHGRSQSDGRTSYGGSDDAKRLLGLFHLICTHLPPPRAIPSLPGWIPVPPPAVSGLTDTDVNVEISRDESKTMGRWHLDIHSTPFFHPGSPGAVGFMTADHAEPVWLPSWLPSPHHRK